MDVPVLYSLAMSEKREKNIQLAHAVLDWNRKYLRHDSQLTQELVAQCFGANFVVQPNGRHYQANLALYLEFLNGMKTAMAGIEYQVLHTIADEESVVFDMAVQIDAAALLIYRAAWTKDRGAARVSREAAMAKLYATEAAQQVIDTALQLHGGDGVRHGVKVEELYRDIRALRIYEGASDVQRVVIVGRRVLRLADGRPDVHTVSGSHRRDLGPEPRRV